MPLPTDRTVTTLRLPIRFNECDLMGIVHHANYVLYLEEARIHFAKVAGIDFAAVVRGGINLAVIALEIAYRRPLVYGQTVDIHCWLRELKSRGMTFDFELRSTTDGEETLHTLASVSLLSVSAAGTPTRIPEAYYQLLHATLSPSQ